MCFFTALLGLEKPHFHQLLQMNLVLILRLPLVLHLKKVEMRTFASYARHVIAEVWLLGRCKVAVLDRYDPVVSLLDFADAHRDPAGDAQDSLAAVNVDFPSRPVILQLWHAFGAYKKFGYQGTDTPEGHPADFLADWRIHRNYSWVVCSGSNARLAFAEAFACPVDRVVALNRPEFDELVEMRRSRAQARLAAGTAAGGRANASAAEKTVLMAPTLRRSSETAHPFRDLHASRAPFESALDARIVWAFHPLETGLPAPGNVSQHLIECDLLVTDYSSIVYEAYVLGKPVLFYVPDIEQYREVSGLNCDPTELCSSLCAYDEQQLTEAIARTLADPESYPSSELDRFASRAFDWTSVELDSAALPSTAEAIVDFLIENGPMSA